MMKRLKVTVIGAGALGKTLIYILSNSGFKVQAWTRDTHIKQLSYQFVSVDNKQSFLSVPANGDMDLAQADLVISTLKVFDITAVLSKLVSKIKLDTPIVVLNNGVIQQNEFIQALGDRTEQIIQAITTMGAYIKDNKVFQKSLGITYFGYLFKQTEVTADIAKGMTVFRLLECLNNTKWVDNIQIYQLEKLAINAVINPMTVKYACKNGDLLAYQNEIHGLVKEIASIYSIIISEKNSVLSDADYLFNKVIDVIEKTKENFSSMYQDYITKRKTEIDHITGFLLTQAGEHDLEIPINHELYEIVTIKLNK